MGYVVSGVDALANARLNAERSWNRSPSSSDRSEHPEDASTRIYDGFARVAPNIKGISLRGSAPVYAMGSCFAREIEGALTRMGGRVVSVDETIQRPEFQDAEGRVRNSFFHRFTPRSMFQEFQQAFDELPGWSAESLLFKNGGGGVSDLNYWHVGGAEDTREAIGVRRRVARDLVRRSAEAEVIILTLGLIEAWRHVPSGLFANFFTPKFLARNIDDFQLELLDVADTIACLEGIDDLLKRHHRTGDYNLVVTVSPVPLASTFTDADIVVADTESKSTLRAAAGAFCRMRDHAHYFPSYELVKFTAPQLAWRPDRIHVNPDMVKHIVQTFVGEVYETGAFTSGVREG